MKYILVVYSHSKKDYRRIIGEPTSNEKKITTAMMGIDRQIGDDYFSVIEEVEDDYEVPNM